MKQLGLIGFGCVGQGFYNVFTDKHPEIRIKKIVVKDKSKIRRSGLALSYDASELIFDPEIDVVIEAIDDATAAFRFATQILEQGKILVTANKKMVAENLPALTKYINEFGGRIYYEGAVCGSIPVIQVIDNYYSNEKINSVKGILNGSTNYILTLMSTNGTSYEEALTDAQIKGFAETDPTLDVEGFDAANKLSILCYKIFGEYIAPQHIPTTGITTIDPAEIAQAQRENKKIKLIASAELINGELIATVKPEVIASDHPLFNIDNEFNSVIIDGEYAGNQQLTGKGAGSLPTGLAVVSDALRAIKQLPISSKLKRQKILVS